MLRNSLRSALSALVTLTVCAHAPAQLIWTQTQPSAAPSARYEHASCDLYGADDVLLFGGTDGTEVLGDTWSWGWGTSWPSGPKTWTPRPGPGPEPRSGHAMARADLESGALLFGGRLASGALSAETWLWKPAGWQQLAPALAPSPRAGHAMATDEMHVAALYLFGGREPGGLSNELWHFSAGEWSLVPTPHSPSAREDHALTWFADGTLLLSGGRDESGVLADEWIFDGQDWRESFAEGLEPRAGHALAFESLLRRRYLSVGGVNGVAGAQVSERTLQSRWLSHATASGPAPRTDASLHCPSTLFVPQYVLFGGRNEQGAALGDTWTLEPLRLAEIEAFGAGCGPGPWGPAGPHLFTMNMPLIGSTVEVAALTAGHTRRALLLVGVERTPTPFGGCELFVMPTKRVALRLTTDPSGFQYAQTEIDLPFDHALVGTQQVIQMIEFSSAGRGLSLPVRLRIEE